MFRCFMTGILLSRFSYFNLAFPPGKTTFKSFFMLSLPSEITGLLVSMCKKWKVIMETIAEKQGPVSIGSYNLHSKAAKNVGKRVNQIFLLI